MLREGVFKFTKKKNFKVPASFENLNFTEHSPRARALKFADFL